MYDSIPSMVTDKKMHEECRPFRKMLPALLNKMVDGRTKRDKQFTFSRLAICIRPCRYHSVVN